MAIHTFREDFALRDVPSPAASALRSLTLLIVLIIGVPSVLIFGPLGSAGTPADVLGLVLLVTWIYRQISTPRSRHAANPVRVAMMCFVAAVLASYIAAAARPISAIELSAADRGLLSVVAWLGMLLVVSDGLPTKKHLDIFLRRLVAGGGALATLGLAQFVTRLPLVNYIVIPGLRDNSDLNAISDRNNLARPAGTAIHPIEFGAVLTMILPFALHYAMVDCERPLLRRWYPVIAIAAAVPISISRSAIVSATVVLIFIIPIWDRKVRRRAYAALFGLGVAGYLVVPGLLGTLTNLFVGISSDSSAQSRSDSYSLALQFIDRSPLFGRGFRTFLPTYRILDNQLLGTLVETGIVGLAALTLLILTTVATGLGIRRAGLDSATWRLGRAVAASVAAAGCSLALFDGFSFPMAACVFFVVIGCGAALLRIASASIDAPTAVDQL